MTNFKIGKKGRNAETINSYFALKSQNELYYQMASIFKEVANGEDKLAEKIFSGILTGNQPKVSLENFF